MLWCTLLIRAGHVYTPDNFSLFGDFLGAILDFWGGESLSVVPLLLPGIEGRKTRGRPVASYDQYRGGGAELNHNQLGLVGGRGGWVQPGLVLQPTPAAAYPWWDLCVNKLSSIRIPQQLIHLHEQLVWWQPEHSDNLGANEDKWSGWAGRAKVPTHSANMSHSLHKGFEPVVSYHTISIGICQEFQESLWLEKIENSADKPTRNNADNP